MSQDILNLQEESFEQVKKALSQYSAFTRELYDDLKRSVSELSAEWSDEDYQHLLEAIKSIDEKLDSVNNTAQQLIAEAEYKIEMIRARKSIKI